MFDRAKTHPIICLAYHVCYPFGSGHASLIYAQDIVVASWRTWGIGVDFVLPDKKILRGNGVHDFHGLQNEEGPAQGGAGPSSCVMHIVDVVFTGRLEWIQSVL
jgi:hypothetical protein